MLSTTSCVLSTILLKICLYVRRSSQNFVRLVDGGRYLLMSEMKSRNRIRPKTLPWITPASTLIHSETVLLALTLCSHISIRKYSAIHLVIHFDRSLSILSSSIKCIRRSNAFQSSRILHVLSCQSLLLFPNILGLG